MVVSFWGDAVQHKQSRADREDREASRSGKLYGPFGLCFQVVTTLPFSLTSFMINLTEGNPLLVHLKQTIGTWVPFELKLLFWPHQLLLEPPPPESPPSKLPPELEELEESEESDEEEEEITGITTRSTS